MIKSHRELVAREVPDHDDHVCPQPVGDDGDDTAGEPWSRTTHELRYLYYDWPRGPAIVHRAELERFTGLATSIGSRAGSNILAGVRSALAAILESPSFVYRVELGASSEAEDGRLRYTGFEMASRLAAVLWDVSRKVA